MTVLLSVIILLRLEEEPKEVTPTIGRILSEVDDGQTVELAMSNTLVVRLKSQLGTGYSWSLRKGGDSVLRLKRSYIESPHDHVPGESEAQVFLFTPIAKGSEDVEFAYGQPWQTGQTPTRTFRFRAVIH